MRRIVSLWLPNLPIERLVRTGDPGLPASPQAPFALVEAGPHGLRLTACNDAARAHGLGAGERLADARARVPGLASAVHDTRADAALLLGLARWAERWSPFVALDAPDGLGLDVTGVAHLFGGEALLLADLADRFGRLGLSVRAGLAGSLAAARALARFAADPRTIVAPGGEREALAGLPVECLAIDADEARTLRRAGLKTVGQLCDIPRPALARRFRGPDRSQRLLDRLDAALGIADEPLSPLARPPLFAVRHAVAEPLITAEAVAALVGHLAETLCARLEAAGRGALRLDLKLYRSDGSRAVVPAGLARASRRADHLLRLLLPRLDTVDLGFGIDAASLEARAAGRLDLAQHDLAPGPGRSGASLAELADRIANRPGGAPLETPVAVASHQPERSERRAGFAEAAGTGPEPPTPPRPLTLFDRPETVSVIATVPDGPPVRFTWRRVARRVVRADGPERIGPDWWRPQAGQRPRDYYVVEDQDGRRYWLYREGLYEAGAGPAPGWFIHGLFP